MMQVVASLFLVMWILCYCHAPTDYFFLPGKSNFFPLVIVDYKTLTLLLVKKDEEDFLLGGRGVSVEFCFFFCNAIRVCMLAM